MNYTFLIYEGPAAFALRTDPDAAKRAAYWAVWPPYAQALRDAGVFGAGLETPDTAVTLRNGGALVQDGTYADTKEQLGGLFIIDVPDLDAALERVARIPAAAGSVTEVRPNLVPPPAEAARRSAPVVAEARP